MMMVGAAGGGSRYPFTTSQWHELELQALVFKYMVSGIPVPSDLILCIRRSLFMDPQTLPFLPNPPPTIGWGAYQVADARKAVDPEPGRCRRTDGKKWRCSKDAYPDSKYCERHMHRGKSRSRKPVELSLATSPASSSPHYSSNFPPPPLPPPPHHLSLSTPPPPPPPQTHHFLFPCSSSSSSSSSSSRPPPAAVGRGFSSHHDDSSSFCLDSLPHTVDHYRNMLGFKEGASEYPFLPMPCSFGPMEMNSKQSYGSMQCTDPHFRLCGREEEEKKKPYFLLGADLKTEKAAAKLDWEREEQQQHQQPQQPTQNARPFHCFLDEKPPKIEGSWMRGMNVDLKTQLSISIPMASHDIPVTASQCYNDG